MRNPRNPGTAGTHALSGARNAGAGPRGSRNGIESGLQSRMGAAGTAAPGRNPRGQLPESGETDCAGERPGNRAPRPTSRGISRKIPNPGKFPGKLGGFPGNPESGKSPGESPRGYPGEFGRGIRVSLFSANLGGGATNVFMAKKNMGSVPMPGRAVFGI